ncbi:hypothetical protein [Rhizobium sp. RCAM05973]|uniref:hypothetical protein n=1 Tax=Rhizobium sp. RCAM05973 TaxID=2994066 RepID=UPI0022EBA8CB|nr:hypothetical protein [Rhizobium sp. RCAM05973]
MRIIYRSTTFFERLIYYFLIPDVIAKIVFEIVLRVPAITVNQPKQFVFYGLLAIEYLWLLYNFKAFRPSFSKVSPFAAVLALMTIQGVVVGIWWGNSLARISIDTINVAVVLLNIFILTDPSKSADTAFGRIFLVNRLYAILMILLSIVAMAVNPVAVISFGGSVSTAVCISLLFAELMLLRKLNIANMLTVIFCLLAMIATLQSWNRTTLMVCGAALLLYLGRQAGQAPYRVISLSLAIVMAAGVGFSMLPEDSALSRRLTGLEDLDLSSRTGSIGEREAEGDAVGAKIAALGSGAVLFGAGHGASYDVKYTWEWKLDYSNAHYGWVLFYLRYGELGYVYLGLWILALFVTILQTWRTSYASSLVICLLAVWNIGYLGTYSYFSFFIAGMPFARAAFRVAFASPPRLDRFPPLGRGRLARSPTTNTFRM